MHTVRSTDDARIAYERRGDGPPLLLLHGDATRSYWDPVAPQFTDDYEVVLPDRRGRGDSGDGDEYSLQREVDDVVAVIDAVDGAPVLFGHSFGGLQAIEAAREVPVAGVVAYEPAVLVGEYREAADLADRMAERLADGDTEGAAKCHLREVLFDGDEAVDLDAWLADWPLWPGYADLAGNLLRMDRAIERYELPDRLDVAAPALVLSGTAGPAHLRDSARAVADALPNGEFREFDGVGHLGPVEAPDRVTEAVLSFLRDRVGAERGPTAGERREEPLE